MQKRPILNITDKALPVTIGRTVWGIAAKAIQALALVGIAAALVCLISDNWNDLEIWAITLLFIAVFYLLAMFIVQLNQIFGYRIVIHGEGVEVGGFMYRQFFDWDDVAEIHVWDGFSALPRPCLSFHGKGHTPKGWHYGATAYVYRSPNIFLFPPLTTIDPVSLTSLMKHAKRSWANSGENRRAAMATREPAS